MTKKTEISDTILDDILDIRTEWIEYDPREDT